MSRTIALVFVAVSFLFVAGMASLGWAAEKPKPGAAPGVVQPAGKIRPLTAPIQMDPSKVKTFRQTAPPPPVEYPELKTACDTTIYGYTYFQGYLNQMKGTVKVCSEKNYSVADQQSAGCKGSDTLDQCMEKLFDYCVSHHGGGYQKAFRTSAEKELVSALKLAKTAQAMANYIEYTLNTYGK